MGSQHQTRAAFPRKFQRWQSFGDARGFGDLPFFERHIEVHADENAFPGKIEIANG